jgi:hypothetical protein
MQILNRSITSIKNHWSSGRVATVQVLQGMKIDLLRPHVPVAVEAQELVVPVLWELDVLLDLVGYPVWNWGLDVSTWHPLLPSGDLIDNGLLDLLVWQFVEIGVAHIYLIMELIGHGAEAKVYKVTKGDISTVVKERLPKKYRHPELDKKINISRLRSEVKIMKKLESKGVRVPRLISVDEGNCSIEMEFIEGKQVKDYINDPATSP